MDSLNPLLLKDEIPLEWRVVLPGTPDCGPMPPGSKKFIHGVKNFTVLVSRSDAPPPHEGVHFSCSNSLTGEWLSNEDVRWLANQLFIDEAHFIEYKVDDALQAAIRERIARMSGFPAPTLPKVRHFFEKKNYT